MALVAFGVAAVFVATYERSDGVGCSRLSAEAESLRPGLQDEAGVWTGTTFTPQVVDYLAIRVTGRRECGWEAVETECARLEDEPAFCRVRQL